MNVSDGVIRFLEEKGIEKVFLLSGGGIMFLLDALGRSEKVGYVCNYHEQACAVSADAFSRVTGFGVCFATVGPGAANALSGIVGAWYDSVPMLVISGQVRSNILADYSKVRQVGPQEGNILEMAKQVTKYAVSIRDPQSILYELQKAMHMAFAGRPGPVWVELPLDIQSAEIDWVTLPRFEPVEAGAPTGDSLVDEVVKSIHAAKRPVLVLGNGVRLSGTNDTLRRIIDKLQIPTIMPLTAKDLLETNHEYAFGIFGTAGNRHANIIIQNSDLIIGLGVGFCLSKTGFATTKFAVGAKKIFVDIDAGQLTEHPLKADLSICADLRSFAPAMLRALLHFSPKHKDWLGLCVDWRQRYPIILGDMRADEKYINSYVFMEALSALSKEGDMIVVGNGLDATSMYQAFNVKRDQRTIVNGNWGSMGWCLPMAIGAHYGSGRKTYCITGDGSLMLNVQELLTIGANRLPIKLFVFNNGGYGSIKATQDNFFASRYVGSNPSSKVFNPNFAALAEAFGLRYLKAEQHSSLNPILLQCLNDDDPVLCEVMISPSQWVSPKATSFRNSKGEMESKPLDDMLPFLPPEEVEGNRRRALAV